MHQQMRAAARLLVCALAAVLLTAATGYQVNHGTNQDITEWSVCKNVANNSPTGKAIFVPTKTSTEWAAFYNASTPGITIANCGCTVTPGSQSYTTAGSFSFTIPCYNTLTVQVWGGGGGGAGATSGSRKAGTTGGASNFDGALVANGGVHAPTSASGGAGGTASGGTTNTTGAAGTATVGGAGANGGSGGGSSGNNKPGKPGSAPGGGGSGGYFLAVMGGSTARGGGGGGGGYTTRSYASGVYTVGTSVNATVGAGGVGGNSTYDGGAGAVGRVTITWN
ncbi:hypothetical protein RLW55_05950 [Hyphomicrobium sp. B1]|uniref:hypothetical protein n=1 Tax=Hyphomicrobium sp. B1 TaxID=3075651 RepID=UPI003C3082F3